MYFSFTTSCHKEGQISVATVLEFYRSVATFQQVAMPTHHGRKPYHESLAGIEIPYHNTSMRQDIASDLERHCRTRRHSTVAHPQQSFLGEARMR